MNVKILTSSSDIEEQIPRCMEFARKIGADLPFSFPILSQQWWHHFNNTDGSFFWQKRGTNFLGSQSALENLYLVTCEENGKIVAFAPFVSMRVLTATNKEKMRVLCYAGDPVFIPFQEITVAPSVGGKAISMLLEQLTTFFLKENFDVFFLGYQLASSNSLPHIRHYFSEKLANDLQWQESIACIRGGVWPWTIRQLSRRINKVVEYAGHKNILIQDEKSICVTMSNCSPIKLMFPGTRKKMETQLHSFLSSCESHSPLAEIIAPVKELLQDRPISYPYITLPKTHELFMASLSRSSRYFYRRYMKSFLKKGGSFEIINGKDIKKQDINDYLELHQARWGKESVFLNDGAFAFHKEMPMKMAGQSLFSLFFALYENKRIAVLSSFDINLRRECYFTGMNPEYQKTRGGRLLWLFSIYDAIDRGFTKYDLGPGDFGYKMSLATGDDESSCFLVTKRGEDVDVESLFAGYECLQKK